MADGSMSYKERFLRALRFQPVDRVPDMEFGAWQQTIDRWIGEGMEPCPNGVHAMLDAYFGVDPDEYGPGLSVRNGLCPSFEKVILEEKGDHQIIQDAEGAISEQLRPELGASIPRYLRFAIETCDDWVKMRDERLNPDHPDRLPRHLDALCRRLSQADYPIAFGCGSLYGWIRDWMGVERVSLTLYDDRPWIEEMMEHVTNLTLGILQKLDGEVRIDIGQWWEDMCGRQGPLMSPRMFREMMVPRYKRVSDFLRKEFGTEFNHVDCDGNIHELAGLWLEGGVNVMFPVEVAHTDPRRLSAEFGKRMPMRGAFDKLALIAGPAAIDAEFERLLPLIQRGGLIPHTDHLVPPDVSLANYIHYRRKKCEIIGKPYREPGFHHRPGHLTRWRLVGPFNNAHNAGLLTAYAPESAADASSFVGKDGRSLRWQPYESNAASGYVDLKAAISADPWCVAYAACSVYSPAERNGWIELGSDDGVKVWLNGEQVWEKDAYRVAWPRQDVLPIHLRQGWNPLLVKVGQAEGDWGFYLRFTDDKGTIWSDLKTQV